jgi:Cu/Ag efflux protein CusF
VLFSSSDKNDPPNHTKPHEQNGSPLQRFALCLRLLMILTAMLCPACRQQPQAEEPATPTPQPAVSSSPPVTSSPVAGKPLEMPSPVFDKPYPGTGIVILINRKEGWVEIKHEEIKGLMPAMTMEFWLKNRSLVDQVTVGDRVDFTVVETRKGEYVTKIKKAASIP